MFQYLRKAVSGSAVKDPRNSLVRDEYRKKKLNDNLALQIKKLQKSHIESNPVIERNDEDALQVCCALEAIFLHECNTQATLLPNVNLRAMFVEGIRSADDEILTIAFWELLKEVTHKDVITQLKHLVVTTEVGLCRAWIRLALNDGLLLSYLDAIFSDRNLLRKYYNENAYLMDKELSDILKELLQGLMHFEFRLNYNTSKLNAWDVYPLQLAGILPFDDKKEEKSSHTCGRQLSDDFSRTARLKDVETKEILGNSSPSSPIKDNFERQSSLSKEQPILSSSQSPQEGRRSQTQEDGSVGVEPEIVNVSLSCALRTSSRMSINEKEDNNDRDEIREETEEVHAEKNNLEKIEVEDVATASAEKDESLTNEKSSQNEYNNMPSNVYGNRLGGIGWSGWSSAFHNDSTDSSKEEVVDEELNKQLESFGSLLKVYGNTSLPQEADVHVESTKQTDENVVTGNNSLSPSGETEENEVISPTSSDANLQQMNFEVVPMSTSLQKQHIDNKTQSSLNQLTVIGLEKGLDKQSFRCKQCGKAIGLIYGPYRVCYFDGGYYCYDCHGDDEHVIPSRVIRNWDFKKYKVSNYNNVFLLKIEEEPLFHIDETNPQLYDIVVDLKTVKFLRVQLKHIRDYVQTCQIEVAEDFRIRLWPREYLCDDVHQYSLLDLIQVRTGQLAHHLKKVITQFSKHIYKCSLCRVKGFICEYCHDDTIIYPFQVTIAVQCPGCLATFHKKCRRDKRCPKCVRIHLRNSEKNELNRQLPDIQTELTSNDNA